MLRPLLQQAVDDLLDLPRRVALREVFAEGLSLECDVVPAGLLLLAHDSQHTVLGQCTGLAHFPHPFGLGNGGGCLLIVHGHNQHGLFLRLQVGDLLGGRDAHSAIIHCFLQFWNQLSQADVPLDSPPTVTVLNGRLTK